VATGVALPLLRRRFGLRPATVLCAGAAGPVALAVVRPRTRGRDAAICALQMWAYVAAYKMPNDDPAALERRVRIDYPIRVDRLLGAGRLPSARLQEAFADPARFNRFEKLLVWTHWLWFAEPHLALAYVQLRRRERFGRAAALTYAVFDVGAILYWAIPTAPPWYAAERGRLGPAPAVVRRMMIEYGEQFWEARWGPLYDVFGGNPLAAMPSLHFATSLMAAQLLWESGPIAGALGWAYVTTLGVALVYLGEHYVIDLVAGAALTQAIRRAAPLAEPVLRRLAAGVEALEARAAV
jgi:membrane-associated phospholipid phosphatase